MVPSLVLAGGGRPGLVCLYVVRRYNSWGENSYVVNDLWHIGYYRETVQKIMGELTPVEGFDPER